MSRAPFPRHKIKIALLENIHPAAREALSESGYTVDTVPTRGTTVALWLPRGVRHPVDEMGRQARKRGKAVTPDEPVPDTVTKALKSSRKVTRKAGRKAGKAVGRKTKRFAGRRRGRLF